MNILKLTNRKLIKRSTSKFIFSNRYYSVDFEFKYKDKLLSEAKQRGLNSIEELKTQLKESIEKNRKEFSKVDPLEQLNNYQKELTKKSNIKDNMPFDKNSTKAPFKTLDDYMKLEKLKELSKQECEFLWRARWSNVENSLNAVIPLEIFNKMEELAKSNPIFVLPLPRANESREATNKDEQIPIELQYVQWQFVGPNTIHCMVTSLAEYKAHQAFARPHTTFEFHSELGKDQGIVLMNGHVEDKMNVSLLDAQLLLLNIQRFWGALDTTTDKSKQRIELLKLFNQGTSNFDIQKLITLAQSTD